MAETYKSGEKVKYRLAEAMKECMKKAPVEKITVKEITEECGVTRQTFYRNFQDKYDLINWYFDKILIESFEHMGEGQTVYESLVNKFQYIQKETLFFRAAFKNDDQNCLRDHDFELITQFYTDRIEGNTGKKMSDKIRFQLEMYCQGSIYMTVQWVPLRIHARRIKRRLQRTWIAVNLFLSTEKFVRILPNRCTFRKSISIHRKFGNVG